jgi:hypothetical protein
MNIYIYSPILLAKDLFFGTWTHFVAIFFAQLPKATPFVFDETEIQAFQWLSKAKLEQRLETSPQDFVGSFPKIWKVVKEKLH